MGDDIKPKTDELDGVPHVRGTKEGEGVPHVGGTQEENSSLSYISNMVTN